MNCRRLAPRCRLFSPPLLPHLIRMRRPHSVRLGLQMSCSGFAATRLGEHVPFNATDWTQIQTKIFFKLLLFFSRWCSKHFQCRLPWRCQLVRPESLRTGHGHRGHVTHPSLGVGHCHGRAGTAPLRVGINFKGARFEQGWPEIVSCFFAVHGIFDISEQSHQNLHPRWLRPLYAHNCCCSCFVLVLFFVFVLVGWLSSSFSRPFAAGDWSLLRPRHRLGFGQRAGPRRLGAEGLSDGAVNLDGFYMKCQIEVKLHGLCIIYE